MKKVDMSDKAITRRLRQTDQLRELSLSLMKAKKVSDEKSGKNKQTGAKSERLSDSEISALRQESAQSMRELAEMPPMFPDFGKESGDAKSESKRTD